jgi:acetyltransferase
MGDLSRKYQKPIFCSFIGGRLVYEGEQILNQNKIPSFRFPERAIAAIGGMWQWRQRQTNPPAKFEDKSNLSSESIEQIKSVVKAAVSKSHFSLDNLEADRVVSALGLPTPPTKTAATLEEAREFASQSGWPVVLKLSAPGLLHKATVGGVVTNIWNEAQLELAWDRLDHIVPGLPRVSRRVDLNEKDVRGGGSNRGFKTRPDFQSVLYSGRGQLAELL